MPIEDDIETDRACDALRRLHEDMADEGFDLEAWERDDDYG